MDYNKENPEHDILKETKKLAEELLKNPEFSYAAIHDRNIIIQSLKADIEHRKVFFKEVEFRYNEICDSLEKIKLENDNFSKKYEDISKKLSDLQTKYTEQTQLLCKAQQDLMLQQQVNEGSWFIRLEKIAGSLYGKWWLIKVVCSRPFSQYLALALFILPWIASFVGWGHVFHFLTPFINFLK